jgi:hypothetical protein
MPATLSKPLAITSWVLQVLVAVILGQTLFFKFSGAPESVYIFETMGMEPWGRYATATAELVAVVLLLVPRTAVFGALLALMVITGAIGGHLTKLGIAITLPDGTRDGGTLFALAVAVFLASAAVLAIRRAQLPILGPRLSGRPV